MLTNAEYFLGRPAVREVVPRDPRSSVRWHQHDYPSPIARWNFHPEYEVHLITQGTGRYIVGDHIDSFTAGELFLIGPELPHDWISDLEPGEIVVGRDIVMQFHDDWISACAQLLPEITDLSTTLANSTRGIQFLGETAAVGAEQLIAIGSSSGSERLSLIFALFATLAGAPEHERRHLANEWIPTLHDPASADVVSQTLEYVFSNLAGDVRLSTAARMIGMSESAFSRYFHRASGHTFSDMVRRLRLAHACKLLDGTTDAIASIAQTVGYRNLSNFNRQFLAELGCTPLQYRRRVRESPRQGGTAQKETSPARADADVRRTVRGKVR
ncbi:AraC family transcriptional regulator [Microbacterium invictum]